MKAVDGRNSIGPLGRPEEVAELTVFLASEAAGYITGSTHFIDGGMLPQGGKLVMREFLSFLLVVLMFIYVSYPRIAYATHPRRLDL